MLARRLLTHPEASLTLGRMKTRDLAPVARNVRPAASEGRPLPHAARASTCAWRPPIQVPARELQQVLGPGTCTTGAIDGPAPPWLWPRPAQYRQANHAHAQKRPTQQRCWLCYRDLVWPRQPCTCDVRACHHHVVESIALLPGKQ